MIKETEYCAYWGCGKLIPVPEVRKGRPAKFCNRDCKIRSYNKGVSPVVPCKMCGEPFERPTGEGSPRLYCSSDCKADGHRASMRKYAARKYLESKSESKMESGQDELQ